jgi:hypothetical protein
VAAGGLWLRQWLACAERYLPVRLCLLAVRGRLLAQLLDALRHLIRLRLRQEQLDVAAFSLLPRFLVEADLDCLEHAAPPHHVASRQVDRRADHGGDERLYHQPREPSVLPLHARTPGAQTAATRSELSSVGLAGVAG